MVRRCCLARTAWAWSMLAAGVSLAPLACRPVTGPWTVSREAEPKATAPISLASAQQPQNSPNGYVQELSRRLQAAADEIRSLEARLAYREEKIEEKNRELNQALKEIQAAQSELAQAREEIEQLRKQNATLQARLDASEKQNRENLQTIAVLLQRFVERHNPPTFPPASRSP